MKHYFINSQKNFIFLGQRLNALSKEYNLIELKKKTKILNGKIFLFTWRNESIQKLKKIINLNNLDKVYCFEVIHAGLILGNGIYSNKILFFIYNLIKKIKLRLKIYYFLRSKILFKNFKVIFKYIYVSSSFKKKNIIKIPKELLIQDTPQFNKNIRKKKNYNSSNGTVFYFDSHFPMHPDSYKNKIFYKNKKMFFEFLNIYKSFLDRKLINYSSNKDIKIFLHPRTYESLNKNKIIKKYIKSIYKKNVNFYSGVQSFYKNFTYSLKKDIFIVQYGTQLSLLKEKIFNSNFKKVKVLELDKKFLNDFFQLKNENLDPFFYTKNYELIEIKPFKNIDNNKFLNLS